MDWDWWGTQAGAVWSAIVVVWKAIDQWSGGIGAIAGVFAAVVAVVTLIRAGIDSRARSQPQVTVEFALPAESDSSLEFVVENSGSTPARDVSLSFDPALDPAESDRLGQIVRSRFGRTFDTINPGQRLSNTWWAGSLGAGGKLENVMTLPEQVTVEVSYNGLGRRRISETFKLDVADMLETTYSESSTSVKGRLKTIDKSLKDASQSLSGINRTLAAAERRDAAVPGPKRIPRGARPSLRSTLRSGSMR